MGLFSRRHNDSGAPTSPAQNRTSIQSHRRKDRHIIDMSTRPSFGQWLKATWLDLLTMAVMGAVGLGVYTAHPAPSRSFPVYFQDGEIVYPEFAYPLRKEIIPIWAAALLASLIPILIILLCQIRVRSFWDVNNGVLGLLYSLITAAVFQVFLKWLIGGLRPHFLTVCAPSIPVTTVQETGSGLRQIMYDRSICTGDADEIDDSLESFPSGHSTAAFAGFVFLSLYLNAKLKLWSNHHPAMWKLAATFAPLLGATLIAGTLTIDEYHNWYDCVAGAVIGTAMAFAAYRTVYASIWDWRFNHVPLNRVTPLDLGRVEMMKGAFTRQAGWGAVNGRGGHARKEAEGMREKGVMRGGNGFGTSSSGVTHHQHGDDIV